MSYNKNNNNNNRIISTGVLNASALALHNYYYTQSI